ncbi:hypothetical protein KI126_002543 [Enterococcus faecium]|nr:hypothetical protein [Enterococcus faecalis]EME8274639.1 hypothetical protein [Enterococcus faecium]EMF0280475.1 hypothetical protein [Enterococcus faecium]
MVTNLYDKYLIEDLRRINSRYYLVKIHGKTYVWDFYDLGDFRNYYPFEVFYPKKKSWKLYDVTGEENEYKSKEQIGYHVPRPMTFHLVFLLFFVVFLSNVYPYISFLIVIIMVIFTFFYIKRISKVDVMTKPCYTLLIAEEEKESLWERKIKPVIVGGIFALLSIVGVFAMITIGFVGLYVIFGFFGLLIVTVGTEWNHNFVPNINIKYQIKENKEN